jgi:creatinine amidohydrolase
MTDLVTDTMVNMTWRDIQEKADRGFCVLLPLGVIEEHGPHLCLGTDIYTAVTYCRFVKDRLAQHNVEALIAPPFYWGICQSTGGFVGSFRIRMETAQNLLIDIIQSLSEFGFTRVFGINAHGDIEQHIAIVEAFKAVTRTADCLAAYLFPKNVLHHYGLTGAEPFICPVEPQTICVSASTVPDIHAGDIETATLQAFYPSLARVEIAEQLAPRSVADESIMDWLLGGKTKDLSPDGYLGNPSAYRSVKTLENMTDYAERFTQAILQKLNQSGL